MLYQLSYSRRSREIFYHAHALRRSEHILARGT